VAFPQQAVAKVRTNKTGSAGNHDTQEPSEWLF